MARAHASVIILTGLALVAGCAPRRTLLEATPRTGAGCHVAATGLIDHYVRHIRVEEWFSEADAICRQGDRLLIAVTYVGDPSFILVAEPQGASMRLHLCEQNERSRVDLLKPLEQKGVVLRFDLAPLATAGHLPAVAMASPSGSIGLRSEGSECEERLSQSFLPAFLRKRPAQPPAAPSAVSAAAPNAATTAAPPSPMPDRDDEAFQKWAAAWAKQNKSHVSEWYAMDLDGDPALERVARVCPQESPQTAGAYLIEDQPGKRVRVTFMMDGRSPFSCLTSSEGASPPWERRSGGAIEHTQNVHRAYETVRIALRRGNVVIVAHEIGGQVQGQDIDWDRRCAKVAPGQRSRWSAAPGPDGGPLARPPGETCYPGVENARFAALALAPL